MLLEFSFLVNVCHLSLPFITAIKNFLFAGHDYIKIREIQDP